MKERSPVLAMKIPWKLLLGVFTLFCLLSISACGGTETARVYDSARVLNTAKVQHAARNLPASVDVYTVNRFNGTQSDFQRAVASKLGGDPNRVVMGIDTQHHYQYIARGQDVPLNSNGIALASNAFAANYGNGDYTRATVAALDTMGRTMGKAPGTGASPLPWLIPLLLIGGLLFLLTRAKRPGLATQGMAPRTSTYQPPQPSYPYDQGTAGPRPLQTTERPPQTGYPYDQGTVTPPSQGKGINPLGAGGLGAAAGGALGYELGKRRTEPGPTVGGTPESGVTGGGATFGPGSTDEQPGSTQYPGSTDEQPGSTQYPGSTDEQPGSTQYPGGTQYGSGKKKDMGGGGSFGKGGSDYGTTDTGGGGTFGTGGSDYGTTDTGGGGTFGQGSDYDDR